MTGHASKKQAVFTKFWLAILKRRYHLEDLGIDG